MKKSLLLSAAALSFMAMGAQEVVQNWDFASHGIFAEFTNPESDMYVSGSYQFVDKAGNNVKGENFINALKLTNTADGKAYYQQHGINNRAISLYDGKTYAMTTGQYYKFVFKEDVNALDEWPSDTPCGEYVLTDDGEGYVNGTLADPYEFIPGDEVEPGVFTEDERRPLGAEYAAKIAANPIIGWEQDTPDYNALGPVRAMWDSAKGSNAETWVEPTGWGIANEADYIPSKGSFDYNRSQQATGCRKDTYIQFPEVQGPCEVVYYIATNIDNKYSKALGIKVTPVVEGTPDNELAQTISDTEGITNKRFYKYTYNYTGTKKVAIRMSNIGHEVCLLNVQIKSQSSSVENIFSDTIDENAPAYNVFGQRVDDSYKGIVIKGGKKFIQK